MRRLEDGGGHTGWSAAWLINLLYRTFGIIYNATKRLEIKGTVDRLLT